MKHSVKNNENAHVFYKQGCYLFMPKCYKED